MQTWQALLLGIVQGFTEFLPVSSSGHLVFIEQGLQIDTGGPLIFEIVLHLGTLLAVLFVYRADIFKAIRFAVFDGWRGTSSGESILRRWRSSNEGWLIVCVIVASIPTALIGLYFEDAFTELFSSPAKVGVALLITGGLLMLSRLGKPGEDSIAAIPLWMAFAIGVVQGIAVAPGISRSGSTIAVALLLGMGRESAGKFSFLMSVPAILGALLLKLLQNPYIEPRLDFDQVFLGFITSFVCGYVALRLLLAFIRGGKIHWWAWYCWTVGILAIVWFGFVSQG